MFKKVTYIVISITLSQLYGLVTASHAAPTLYGETEYSNQPTLQNLSSGSRNNRIDNMEDINSVLTGSGARNIREGNRLRSRAIQDQIDHSRHLREQASTLSQLVTESLNAPPIPLSLESSVDDQLKEYTRRAQASMQTHPGTIDLRWSSNVPTHWPENHTFMSSSGEVRTRLEQSYARGYALPSNGFKRENIRTLALSAIVQADKAYSQSQLEDAQFYDSLATSFLDIGVGLDPVTGLARSSFELYTGRNFITGENLTKFERSVAFLGVLTAGAGTTVVHTAQIATRMYYVFEGATVALRNTTTIESAIRGGQKLYTRVSHLMSATIKSNNITAIHKAEHVNATHFHFWPDTPPFQLGSHVIEFSTVKETQWVRVHGMVQGESKQVGDWIMRKTSIESLTAAEIQIKYSLPKIPTHVSDVLIPAKTNILRGNIQSHTGNASGSVQYWLKGWGIQGPPTEWFTNVRPLR